MSHHGKVYEKTDYGTIEHSSTLPRSKYKLDHPTSFCSTYEKALVEAGADFDQTPLDSASPDGDIEA